MCTYRSLAYPDTSLHEINHVALEAINFAKEARVTLKLTCQKGNGQLQQARKDQWLVSEATTKEPATLLGRLSALGAGDIKARTLKTMPIM